MTQPEPMLLPDPAYRQGYETLRRHAIQPEPAQEPGHGRAVLVRRGLAAWLFTAADASRETPSQKGSAAPPRTRLHASADVIDVLLAMIRPHLQRTCS